MGAVPRRGARRPGLRPAQAGAAQRDPRPRTARRRRSSARQAPDTGNMEILAAYGTDEQKERWLYPLMNQEIWSALLDDRAAGRLRPQPVQDHARRSDGDEWVINGEKWFTSSGQHADILFVMCHERHVRGPSRARPASSSCDGAGHPRPHPLQRRAGPARPPARPEDGAQGAGPAAARRRAHPPRDAHGRASASRRST